MSDINKKVKKRILFVLTVFIFALVALTVRVAWIQIINGSEYKKLAAEQQTRGNIIKSNRGTIFDRNGKAVAMNSNVNTISITPSLIRKSDIKIEEIAKKLAQILDLKENNVLTKINSQSGYELLKKKVDVKIGEKIAIWSEEEGVKGINIEEATTRIYPFNNLASHVIGFTGDDNQGLNGIEATMESKLKGIPGKIFSEIDAIGIQLPFSNENYISPREGLNVVLTIDETIQYFADNALSKAIKDNRVVDGATAIVMDPNTGEILAMVSKPDYNPNNPFKAPKGVNEKTWKGYTTKDIEKLQSTVWRNKAVVDTYEPGSTFKAITAAAALEENIVSKNTITSDDNIKVRDRVIKCWRYPWLHGTETFEQGLCSSCNPVFVKAALAMGVERFYKYMRAFGFYEKTGIQLPGEAGSIMHENPTDLDMSIASFGQRFQITPIQLITSYAAIANGGKLLKPQLVKELTDSEGNVVEKTDPEIVRNVISVQTSETLRGMLEKVVSTETGTGRTAYLSGYRVGGKTGTSETMEKGRYIASFASIAPADNPQICVLVVLDNPTGIFGHGGGATAGYAAKEILEETLNYLQVEKVFSKKDKAAESNMTYVPLLSGKKLSTAKSLASQNNLRYRIIGEEDNGNLVVTEQSPKSGVSLLQNSIVVLYTGKKANIKRVTMPNLNRMLISEAIFRLNSLGLNIKINGTTGTAMRQSVATGKKVELGEVIEVEFRYIDDASSSNN